MKKLMTLCLLSFVLCVPALVAVAQTAPASPAQTPSIALQWPLSCILQVNCFVTGYPDLRAGKDLQNPQDFKCGQLTEPGQQGTVIQFIDQKTALSGQNVLAAADGRVVFVRQDVRDGWRYSTRSSKACGNEVQIRHRNGYSTRYCHLSENSITVKPGQRVQAGDVLGQVGKSGDVRDAELEFIVLRRGVPVDPFTNRSLARPSSCFSLTDKSLWADPVDYPPAVFVAGSFADKTPSEFDLNFDSTPKDTLSRDTDKLVAWVRVLGIHEGDEETLSIYTPSGNLWHREHRRHIMTTASWLSITEARPAEGDTLVPGTWKAVYTLVRDGEKILSHSFTVKVE